MITTDRGNFVGSYPPVYYAFMGIFASTNLEVSAIVMRVVNALLFVCLTSALYLLLGGSRRRTLIWMWMISLVPLGTFLIASNNPSSWAVIAGGSLWLTTLGYLEAEGTRRWPFGILAAVFTLMGAGARADAAIYGVVAIGIAFVLTAERTRRFWVKAVLPIALVFASIAFYLTSRQSSVSESGLSAHHDAVVTNVLALIWNNFIQIPNLWAGALGTWNLGWLDVAMPAAVWTLAILAFGAMTFVGLTSHSARKLIALVLALGMLVAVPSWVLLQSRALVGEEVQPRYVLPLLILFAGIALLQAGPRAIVFTRLQIAAIALAVCVAGVVALHATIQHYVSGASAYDWNLNHSVHWWWSVAASPMVVWLIGGVAFAAAVVISLREVTIGSRRTSQDDAVVGAVPITR